MRTLLQLVPLLPQREGGAAPGGHAGGAAAGAAPQQLPALQQPVVGLHLLYQLSQADSHRVAAGRGAASRGVCKHGSG